MKSLYDYLLEDGDVIGIAPSIGNMEDAGKVTFANPGNTLGMGNPRFPTAEEPGSEPMGKTRKMIKDKKKKKH